MSRVWLAQHTNHRNAGPRAGATYSGGLTAQLGRPADFDGYNNPRGTAVPGTAEVADAKVPYGRGAAR